jgi:hypothetical protein
MIKFSNLGYIFLEAEAYKYINAEGFLQISVGSKGVEIYVRIETKFLFYLFSYDL